MKLVSVPTLARVYVYSEPINMCKSFQGLSDLVEEELGKKVLDGDLFLFANKKSNYLKVFFWRKNGLHILAKKLPAGVFDVDLNDGSLTLAELQRLVDHVVVGDKKPCRALRSVKKRAA